MPALKEKPKLNKWDLAVRELVALSTAVDNPQGGLHALVIKRLLLNPDQPQNFIQVAIDIRRTKNTSATDYNVKKTLRFLTEHGVVVSLHGGMFKLSAEMRELILEATLKNVKNRQKRQGL